MSQEFALQLKAIHTVALRDAERALLESDYQQGEDGSWAGTIELDKHGKIPAIVRLPTTFPDALPDVYIDISKVEHRLAHVEASGRICIAPTSGILIDASRPYALVQTALAKARSILIDELNRNDPAEFTDELEAYWLEAGAGYAWSICDPGGQARPISYVGLSLPSSKQVRQRLFADTIDAARTWSIRTGWRVTRPQPAFMLPFNRPFVPPGPNTDLRFPDIRALTEQYATASDQAALMRWLASVSLPVAILFAVPLGPAQDVAIVGVDLRPATDQRARQAQRGFRNGKVPAIRALHFQQDKPVTRLVIERLDPTYVLPRGGATTKLLDRTIVVIGCGAVGSHVIRYLSTLGVGQLRLIDQDVLRGANIHRHTLGSSYLGLNKAHGMAIDTLKNYPHLSIEYRQERIETVLHKEPTFVKDADLIVMAIGDPTLELRLNELFGPHQPRLHVWLDPLGVGGHILVTGLSGHPGCYRCIYDYDPVHGLVNNASFVAPGQTFLRSLGGCSGQYVPFAGLDASRIADEAARLSTEILRGKEIENVLFSIRMGGEEFHALDYKLGPRAAVVSVGSYCRETRHVQQNCPVCGTWT